MLLRRTSDADAVRQAQALSGIEGGADPSPEQSDIIVTSSASVNIRVIRGQKDCIGSTASPGKTLEVKLSWTGLPETLLLEPSDP